MIEKSWILGDKVLVRYVYDGVRIIKGIDIEKFVSNYKSFFTVYPKFSMSRGIVIPRRAIETCYSCKERKPLTEFNCYAPYEAPCFDCCNDGKRKQNFTLPIALWYDNFDVNDLPKPTTEIVRLNESYTKHINVEITNNITGKTTVYPTIKSAAKALGCEARKDVMKKKRTGEIEVRFCDDQLDSIASAKPQGKDIDSYKEPKKITYERSRWKKALVKTNKGYKIEKVETKESESECDTE